MIGSATLEGKTWERISRKTNKEKIMTYFLKFRKKAIQHPPKSQEA
jgi:hypothetical protein